MKYLLMLIACIGVIWLIEHIYCVYLESLPKGKRDDLIKMQTQMRCHCCGSKDFEIIGMTHGKVKFQCKYCKKSKRQIPRPT